MRHNAKAVRLRTGWARWFAACGVCGWTSWRTGREDAETLAEGHNQGRMD